MFSKSLLRTCALVLCLLGLTLSVTALEVDCDSTYCFSADDFAGEEPLVGICITGLPDANTGTVMLGARVLRPGDILTADQMAKMTFSPLKTQQDQEAVKAYHMVSNLMLIIVTCGILLAMLALEFGVPLLFGNGQTVGKKVFSLCVVRNDGVKLNGFQHFTRAVLGKYAVETMIPVYVVIMLMQGQSVGLLLLLVIALLLAQCILVLATRNRCPIHDLMAGTVVVDYGSQKIFKSTEDLIAYQKKIAADRAARQDY